MGKEYCLEIIDRCEPTEEGRDLKCLGIDGKYKNVHSVFHLFVVGKISTTNV